jgi:HEPN domain-containing protein
VTMVRSIPDFLGERNPTAGAHKVNRAAWQKLASERVKDAKALLKTRRWAAAYYVAGYAVECGLKSCIIAYLMTTDEFPDKRFSEQCWTHDLERLLALAGLGTALAGDMAVDADLLDNWDIVRRWSESSRYVFTPKDKAERMVEAVADSQHGVLSWIKQRW